MLLKNFIKKILEISLIVLLLPIMANAALAPLDVIDKLKKPMSFQSMQDMVKIFNKENKKSIKLELFVNNNLKAPFDLNVKVGTDSTGFQLSHAESAIHNPELIQPYFAALIYIFVNYPQYSISSLSEALILKSMGNAEAEAFVDSTLSRSMSFFANHMQGELRIVFQNAAKNLNSNYLTKMSEVLKERNIKMKQMIQLRNKTGLLAMYEQQEKKLNDLIMANDRSGVRKMLEAYLPWMMMTETEKAAWKIWLEAIEHPSKTDVTVAYRGLDYSTDKLQRNEKGEIGLMSTVLTQNQGSYTRRLRSLTTNRINNGQDKQNGNLSTALTMQFGNHALDPKASSFLSFTNDLNVTYDFTELDLKNGKPRGGLLAVKIDSRRLFPNVASPVIAEREFLAPLIIFPDEILLFQENDIDFLEFAKEVRLIVEKQLKLGSLEKVMKINSYIQTGLQYQNLIYTKAVQESALQIGSCKSFFGL